jgi:peptidoglycan/xylan/chitin deacetylase (PgdA/CDA1 family)
MGILGRILKRPGTDWKGWHLFGHRVSTRVPDTAGFDPLGSLSITPDALDRVLAHFCSLAQPISLDRFVESVGVRNALPSSFFIVSFDDGFLDNSETAWPILAKHDVPATLFATTGFIEGSVAPVERVLADFVRGTDYVILENGDSRVEWRTDTVQEKNRCYQEIRGLTRPLADAERRRVLESLRPRCDPNGDRDYGFMSPAQLRDWTRNRGLSVGSHSHSHPVLTGLSARECLIEIDQSLSLLDQWLGGPVRHFSYPYGEWSPKVAGIVRGADLRSGSTTSPKQLLHGVDVMALPRMEIQSSWAELPDELVMVTKA